MSKYSYNEHYFDTVDTEDKAYFLGLLFADGCNRPIASLITISLQASDKDILYTFNDYIESNRTVKVYELKNPNHQDQYKLSITSAHMSTQLTELGCLPRKSLLLKFPTKNQVPKHLLRHFIRGYFDGDGCISWNSKKKNPACQCQLASTSEFCESIKILLNEELDISSSICHPKGTKISILSLNQRSSLVFLNWIYNGSKLFLKRKYDKYQEFLNIFRSYPARSRICKENGDLYTKEEKATRKIILAKDRLKRIRDIKNQHLQ